MCLTIAARSLASSRPRLARAGLPATGPRVRRPGVKNAPSRATKLQISVDTAAERSQLLALVLCLQLVRGRRRVGATSGSLGTVGIVGGRRLRLTDRAGHSMAPGQA